MDDKTHWWIAEGSVYRRDKDGNYFHVKRDGTESPAGLEGQLDIQQNGFTVTEEQAREELARGRK